MLNIAGNSARKLIIGACALLLMAGCDQYHRVIIGDYGDSTTAGFQVNKGVPTYTSATTPSVTQKILQKEFGKNVYVVNRGVSGIQALTLLTGATDFTDQILPWSQEMAQTKASIITINVGINDALYYTRPTPGREPQSPEQFESTMTKLVQIAKAAGKKVILFESIPTSIPDLNKSIELYNAKLQAVATAQDVPIVHKWVYATKLEDYNSLLSDGVHPGDELYTKIAHWNVPAVAAAVKEFLNR